MLRRGHTRSPGRLSVLTLALSSWLLVAAYVPAASAQLLRRAIALQGARIETMDGPAIEQGTVVIAGDRIRAVGGTVKLPALARRIDVQGRTITPGLIDSWSLLGRRATTASASGGALRRAEDAFDRYDAVSFREALQHGVTAVYLSPRGPAGVCGTGAVIRLTGSADRDGPCGSVLQSQAALCIDLDSGSKPVARLKTFQAVRKKFEAAQAYRRSWEDYQEDLSEYVKQLEERNKKKPKPSEKPAAAEEDDDDEEKEEKPRKEPASKAEKSKAPDKPRRPRRSPENELLLRALDREIPVRVLAHRSSDILNALALADEFSLDLILEGAVEAHLVADQIAAAPSVVVLGRLDIPATRRDDLFRRASRQPAATLDAAGVSWVVGSGATSAGRARFVGFNAQLAVTPEHERSALQLVTADAADVLRVDRQIGRLRPGMLADLVVWSGPPSDPASKVLQVYVGGKQVLESPGDP